MTTIVMSVPFWCVIVVIVVALVCIACTAANDDEDSCTARGLAGGLLIAVFVLGVGACVHDAADSDLIRP